MKAMKASSTNAKNKTMKAMKGKAMNQARLAMGQWAIQVPEARLHQGWVWLWKAKCTYQWRCQQCRRPWSASLPHGLHARIPSKDGSKAKTNWARRSPQCWPLFLEGQEWPTTTGHEWPYNSPAAAKCKKSVNCSHQRPFMATPCLAELPVCSMRKANAIYGQPTQMPWWPIWIDHS